MARRGTSHASSERLLDFDSIPDEILVMILSHLDSQPRSETHTRTFPQGTMFETGYAHAPLKQLSFVCKRWRRIVSPALYRHLYIDLDNILVRSLSSKNGSLQHGRFFDTHHEQAVMDQLKVMTTELSSIKVTEYAKSLLVLFRADILYNTLKKVVDQAMPAIWRHLLEAFDLQRIVLLSPFYGLAALTSVVQSSFLTSVTSTVRNMNILELDVKSESLDITSNRDTSDYGMATKSPTDFRFKTTSMLHMRSWSHIGLNEGNVSDLDEQYEYDGPATVSLLPYLFPPCCVQRETDHSHRWAHLRDNMTFLDSFSYTGVMVPPYHIPSMRHDAGVHPFHYLRKLNLKILPDIRDVKAAINDIEDDDEVQDYIVEHDNGFGEIYADLRSDVLDNCSLDGWRLNTVVSDDHEMLYRIPGFASDFQDEMHKHLFSYGMLRMEPRLIDTDWGRVWTVVDAEDNGRMVKVMRIEDKIPAWRMLAGSIGSGEDEEGDGAVE